MTRAAGDPRSAAFLGRWTLLCGGAELIGIAAGAGWWLAWDQVSPDPVGLPAQLGMLAAKGVSGAVEGAVLGLAQVLLLRRLYPALSTVGWIAATGLMAVVGWTIGSSFAIFAGSGASGPPPNPGPLATILMASGFGVAVGALFGAVQALVLRGGARRAWVWVTGNAAGWALALPIIYLAASADFGSATLPVAAGSGIAAGMILGLVTGVALRWMPARETSR